MPLYPEIKARTDDEIDTNGVQAITGEVHNLYLHDQIDNVGARQFYANPALTDNPNLPDPIQNPRSYLALPGIYPNFDGMEVVAPLGEMNWDGDDWIATQIPFPSPYNYFRAKTSTTNLMSGTAYTSIAITQMLGGYTAKAGQWVQLVNRVSGKFDHVQLKADLGPADTSISIVQRTLVQSFPIGSIVELFPVLNMRWWPEIMVAAGGLNYVDLPATWRPPPVEAIDTLTYMEIMDVVKDGFQCTFEETPTQEFHYGLDAAIRTRIIFSGLLEASSIIRVKLFQPAVLEV